MNIELDHCLYFLNKSFTENHLALPPPVLEMLITCVLVPDDFVCCLWKLVFVLTLC